MCFFFFKWWLYSKRILFYLRREKKKRERKKKKKGEWQRGGLVGERERKKVWFCNWTPWFSTYLQKDQSINVTKN